jgi:hypothetical protein
MIFIDELANESNIFILFNLSQLPYPPAAFSSGTFASKPMKR